jgi:hypothetical protein
LSGPDPKSVFATQIQCVPVSDDLPITGLITSAVCKPALRVYYADMGDLRMIDHIVVID